MVDYIPGGMGASRSASLTLSAGCLTTETHIKMFQIYSKGQADTSDEQDIELEDIILILNMILTVY
jgi:hypothetical protein